MSWNVRIVVGLDDTAVAPFAIGIAGATVSYPRDNKLETTITYNYSGLLQEALGFPFTALNGQYVSDTKLNLAQSIKWMQTEGHRYRNDHDEDESSYWAATPENVERCLSGLFMMALLAPDNARWEIT